jgi:DNA-binding transcriptional regulator/RsmH inhibitor MraZ
MDKDRRVRIPAEYLQIFDLESVIIFCLDGPCLVMMSLNSYEKFEEELFRYAKEQKDRSASITVRKIVGNICQVVPDKYHRITLSQELVKETCMSDSVLIYSKNKYIEFWNPAFVKNSRNGNAHDIFLILEKTLSGN